MSEWYGWSRLHKTAAMQDEEWYHGSSQMEPFEKFDPSKRPGEGNSDSGHTQPKHWNCHLGSHFSSDHQTAAGLAFDHSGTVYHVGLAMKNPKHYFSEADLDSHAHDWAYDNGFHKDLPSSGDPANDLRFHPKVTEIAKGFKKHLRSQGYDGITYGNEYEGPHLHECAIAFKPKDITIHSVHHSAEPCADGAVCKECLYPHDETAWGNCSHCGHDLAEDVEPGAIHPKTEWSPLGTYSSLMRHFAFADDEDGEYYHATIGDFSPGDRLVPPKRRGITHEHGQGEDWRNDRIWLARDPRNAAGWHEDPSKPLHVYQVKPIGVKPHQSTDYDFTGAPETVEDYEDQHQARGGVVVRRLDPSEWQSHTPPHTASGIDPMKTDQHARLLQAHLEEHHPEILDKPLAMHDALHRAIHTREGQGWGSGKRQEDPSLTFHEHDPLIDPSVSRVLRLMSSLMDHFSSGPVEVHRGAYVELSGDDLEDALKDGNAGVHRLITQKVLNPGEYHGAYSHRQTNGGEGVGVHWTHSPQVAENFSDPYARHSEPKRSRIDYHWWHIPVTVHGTVAPEHVEDDPEMLAQHRVNWYGHNMIHGPMREKDDEQEVLLRPGAPVKVHSVQARLPEGDPAEHYEKYAWNDTGAPEPHSWVEVHHGEPIRAQASASLWPQHPLYRPGDRVMHDITGGTMKGQTLSGTVREVFPSDTPDSKPRINVEEDAEHGLRALRYTPGTRSPQEWYRPHDDASDEQMAHYHRQVAKNEAGEPYVPEHEQNIDESDRVKVYHLTNKHDFALDPTHRPHNNTTMGGSLSPRLFTGNPDTWAEGEHHYRRPYVAEIDAPRGAFTNIRGYLGENEIHARHFDKAKVTRVLPYEEYRREREEDGYRSPIDTRTWTPEQHTEHLRQHRETLHSEHNWGWNEFNDKHEHVGLGEDDWDEHMPDASHGYPGTYVRRDKQGRPMTTVRSVRNSIYRFAPETPEGTHSIYRGLYLGGDTKSRHVPPAEGEGGIGHLEDYPADYSDQGILDQLAKHHQWRLDKDLIVGPEHPAHDRLPMYGSHWTQDPHLARQFALDASHGHYRAPGPPRRATTGVVLETQTAEPPEHDPLGSQFGESETRWPGRDKITKVLAHVHRYDPDESPDFYRTDTHVRTFEIPPEHLTKHSAKDDDIAAIQDLLGPAPKPMAEQTPREKAKEREDHERRVRQHQAWQSTRPGVNPGDDLSGGMEGYPHAEWVPIEVAQRFRDHHGDQNPGSRHIVGALTEQLQAGRGMTDPLMLLHHNEQNVAHLGEGNHRLVAAENADWTHVPMRVVRMYDGEVESKGKPIPHDWVGTHQGRTPEMAKPSQVFAPSLFDSQPSTKDSGDHGDQEARHLGRRSGGRPGLGRPQGAGQDAGALPRVRDRLRRFLGGTDSGGDIRGLTWHRAAEKEFKRLDKPSQKAVQTTLDALQRNDPNLQTHRLAGDLKGWYSTKASRGHRIVHQPTDDGGIYIGGVSLHEYPNQRFGAKQQTWYHRGDDPRTYPHDGRWVHLGTRPAAAYRGDIYPHSGLYRVTVAPQHPANSPTEPAEDYDANRIDGWLRNGAHVNEEGEPHIPEGFISNSKDRAELADSLKSTGFEHDHHDALYYTNSVEDLGQVSMMVHPRAITDVEEIAEPQHPLWARRVVHQGF